MDPFTERVNLRQPHIGTRSMSGGVRLALVIGINYKGSGAQLGGCEVDANKMTAFFERKGYAVTMMTETAATSTGNRKLAPTKANITATLNDLLARPGLEKFAFTFAGHGSQLRDLNGDEQDRMDECLVCQSPAGAHVMPTVGDFYRDDDLLALFRNKLTSRAVDCFCVIDACHSGTIMDIGWEVTRQSGWRNVAGYVKHPNDVFNLLVVSGCQDAECSLEAGDGGGMMTNKFMAGIRKHGGSVRGLNQEFSSMGLQCPQISCSTKIDLDCEFGESIVPTESRAFDAAAMPNTNMRLRVRTIKHRRMAHIAFIMARFQ